MNEVELATSDDIPHLAGVLARAFRDNPAFLGILRGDGPEQRLAVMEICMLGFVRAVQRYGVVEVIKHDAVPVATALWFRPGGYPMPLGGQLITAAGVLRSRLARTHRFVLADSALQRRHPRAPHCYLWFLGVDPDHQGKGFGSSLLRSLTARADAAQQLFYLEADVERNVRLYQRHGFEVTADAVLAGVATRMWFMQRPAAR